MSQKASEEKMPALIAELANRSVNVLNMKALKKFVARLSIPADETMEFAKAYNWLENVIGGEDARCAEIKAQLPDQDTTIKLGEAPAETPMPTSVGGVEMTKGEEVLQPA